ncbi:MULTISPECIES: MarR family winged helix-turn-helix transcriptional regulator [Halomonadaceae]|jgi:MarR family transcriptional regulator, organic hydroperoxide resistance regulator|uniref:MarR family transcriptional regulator n=1 Tax=Halomonas campaniensis TaxID=213554 RepID=A0A246RZW4_9GAMM|nr:MULTISPECIES: MarR family transcriptional regulator [Halomonas]UEQ04103.1 MarR family transcriptional regulator [Halomonas profundus]KIN16949.1 MarR family transcriptional regulator [Halomonas sp. KHS3]MBS3668183.1 MarR family transcriptional regulator [Halomonas boliviensis]OWV29661.1 MarR family transcriptional regulator [Halomonas campaniensis]QNU63825.1 MarR family transcriptional regulator [Halomonas titanicae]
MVDKDELSSSFFPLADEFRSRDFPFYWVARLNAKYSADVDTLLKPLGLSSSKWRILMILHEHGRLSMSDISVHAVAKLSTITKIVYRMQESGLLKTEASPQDGRVTEVELTEAGEAKLDIARQVTSRLVEKAFADFSKQDIVYINQCLSRMFHNLNAL